MKLEHGLLIAVACAGAAATAHNSYYTEGSVAVLAAEGEKYPAKSMIFDRTADDVFSRLISTPLDQGLQTRNGMKIVVSTPAAKQILWSVSADGEHLGSILVSIIPLKPTRTQINVTVDIRETQFLGHAGIAGISDIALMKEASYVVLNDYARERILDVKADGRLKLQQHFSGGRRDTFNQKMSSYDQMMAERRRKNTVQRSHSWDQDESEFVDPFQKYRSNSEAESGYNTGEASEAAAEAASEAASAAREAGDAARRAADAARAGVGGTRYP